MPGNGECCSNGGYGCQIAGFSTIKKCPTCGRRLRLIGRSQLLEFRLTCQNCGYQSPPTISGRASSIIVNEGDDSVSCVLKGIE